MLTHNFFVLEYTQILDLVSTGFTFLFRHTDSSLQHLWSITFEVSSGGFSRQIQVKRDEVRTQCLTEGDKPHAFMTFLLAFTSISAMAFYRKINFLMSCSSKAGP